MNYVLIAIAVVVLAAFAIFTVKRNGEIKKNGVETDAVVSRIKESETTDDNGNVETNYTYYVTYRTEDGQEIEAKLGKLDRFDRFHKGDRVRIKYIPEKPKYVIRAE